jgi:1-deoxy-D-xylulose-5-phosphate reductoisomerase
MSDLIADCMEKINFVANPRLEDYVSTNEETRMLAKKIL